MEQAGIERCLVEQIELIRDYIKNKEEWCDFNYNYILKQIRQTQISIDMAYRQASYQTIREALRQMLDNTYIDDVDIFAKYFNAFLYLEKLKQKVIWHQTYGTFPEKDKL